MYHFQKCGVFLQDVALSEILDTSVSRLHPSTVRNEV